MANRLTRIYTRTGDDGTTGLADGSRMGSVRVEALGSVGELNRWLGVLLSETLPEAARQQFVSVQHRSFNRGGDDHPCQR